MDKTLRTTCFIYSRSHHLRTCRSASRLSWGSSTPIAAVARRRRTSSAKSSHGWIAAARFSSTTAKGDDYVDAVVVGAGPGGIAVVGNLLDQLPSSHRQLWVDPSFEAGRVGARYREVPSNTKADLFLQFATCIAPFKKIVDGAAAPNAATELAKLPQDQGCVLAHAADICLMLTQGVKDHYSDRVAEYQGKVVAASLDKATKVWTVTLDNGIKKATSRLVLCTGSHPISAPLPILSKLSSSCPSILDLDVALKPTLLASRIPPAEHTTIAVIGASHSAILVLMNLYRLTENTHPRLRIKWFTRHTSLKYAQYMDGWILYDNTGLKGEAAKWARENLEDKAFASSPVSKVITRLHTQSGRSTEEDMYLAELPGCSHVVQAVGYSRDPIPDLSIADSVSSTSKDLAVEHDSLTGRFVDKGADPSAGVSATLPGLFGAGIAFPERVKDPAGNVEYAVGFWKFMRFLRRVVPEWVAKP